VPHSGTCHSTIDFGPTGLPNISGSAVQPRNVREIRRPVSETYGPEYFRSQNWWRDETLKDWIARNVACAPARPALITTSARISYEELNERARRIAAGLAGLGVRKGEIVAVRLPNLPEFVLAWLAINSLGAVRQTLHMAYGKREVERLLQHSAARSKSHPA
jgi:non-ribosomal peptide synthetase component E (peptide arylation enzyme)